MKQVLLLILLLLLFTNLHSQPERKPKGGPSIGRLYGKIFDSASKEPLAYATISVVQKKADGSDNLISGGLSEDNGDFNITSLPMGIYFVKVSYIGYEEKSIDVKISGPNLIEQDLGDIYLSAEAHEIGSVEITAEKSTMSMSLEKKVFNVDKNITATGGTAEDVMKNIPSISVDTDGNAKLRDRDVTVYVDGKPTLMTLNQIPADQVESVEVISNPSAKYEASAMGGILNIVLKQNRKAGYNGMIGLGIGTQDRYNANLNLNMNKGKWNVGGFYSFMTSNSLTSQYVKLQNLTSDGSPDGFYNQNSEVGHEHTFNNGRLNVDHQLDNRNSLSIVATVFRGSFNIPVVQKFESLSASNDITGFGNRTTVSENDFTRNSLETAWKKTYATKNKSLTTFVNYSWGKKTGTSDWTTSNFNKEGVLLEENPQLVKTNDQSLNDQVTFQLDFSNPLSETSKMEMGVRSFYSNRDQYYFFNEYDHNTNAYQIESSFSQDAKITESINAAYFMYSGRMKYSIDYQAGLRFEQSSLKGLSRLDGQGDFGYDYPKGNSKDILRSLFPSLHLGKNLDEATEIGLNFSRKIQRPNFRQIMPGIRSNDQRNIEIGNPALQPEFINLAELSYRKIFGQNNFLTTLYYSNETNTIKPFTSTSTTDPDVLITQFINGDNELKIGLDNTLKLAIGNNADLMVSVNVFKFDVVVNDFSNSGWSSNSKLNFNYKLPSNFSVQLNGTYEGNRPIPQGDRKGNAFCDLAIKKSFLNNKANVVFSITDVFNSRKDITIVELPSYTQESLRRRDSRYFKLTFQMPFGKVDSSFKKNEKRPENQEMQEF